MAKKKTETPREKLTALIGMIEAQTYASADFSERVVARLVKEHGAKIAEDGPLFSVSMCGITAVAINSRRVALTNWANAARRALKDRGDR